MVRNRPAAARCSGKPRIRILQPRERPAPACAGQKASSAQPGVEKAQDAAALPRPSGSLRDWASI